MGDSSSVVRPAKDLLFIVYCQAYSYIINAVDKNGVRLRQYDLTLEAGTFPYAMGFAGMGSKLFMIGGLCTQHVDDTHSFDVHILDISTFSSFKNKEPKSLTVAGPKLNAPKIRPITFVIRGSIYALSNSFPLVEDGVANFEVLHASSSSWTVLPEPSIDRSSPPHQSCYEIVSYAITSDRYVVISVSYGCGVYTFDLAQPTAPWMYMSTSSLSFNGNAISMWNGVTWDYFAFAEHCQCGNSPKMLSVFNDVMDSSCGNVTIRAPSPKVAVFQERVLVKVDEKIFVVRRGFAKPPEFDKGRRHTIEVYCFEVSKKVDKQGKIKYGAVNHNCIDFVVEESVTWVLDAFLHCIPLSSSG